MKKIVLVIILISITILLDNPVLEAQSNTNCSDETIVGLQQRTLDHDEIRRRYLLYIPESYDVSEPAPVVFTLHGFSSNPEEMMQVSQFNDLADEEGFLAVYPSGTLLPLRWNAGTDFLGQGSRIDDVGFLDALIQELIDIGCADPARVYLSGLSNGGGMVHRFVCERPNRVAAVATVAGAYPSLDTECQTEQPIPFLNFHGTADEVVPYAGGQVGAIELPPIEEWVQSWAERNQCNENLSISPVLNEVSSIQYTSCANDSQVVSYIIEEGGHTWAGSPYNPPFLGKTTLEIDATLLMWDFFQQFVLKLE